MQSLRRAEASEVQTRAPSMMQTTGQPLDGNHRRPANERPLRNRRGRRRPTEVGAKADSNDEDEHTHQNHISSPTTATTTSTSASTLTKTELRPNCDEPNQPAEPMVLASVDRRHTASERAQMQTPFRRRLRCARGVETTRELRRSARVAVEHKWQTIGRELRLISDRFARERLETSGARATGADAPAAAAAAAASTNNSGASNQWLIGLVVVLMAAAVV